jgi:hypothetical protein
MNANGVLGSLCFPTFPGFAGQRFQVHADRDVSMAAIQAYNDWHLHDWCNAAPGRFIPLMIVPWWDMKAAAAEVERLARQGVHALSLSDNPAIHGYPSIHIAIIGTHCGKLAATTKWSSAAISAPA